MAKIKFRNGIVEDYTIVLSTRDFRHLGQLSGLKSVHYSGNMNSANEMSFSVYKDKLVVNVFEEGSARYLLTEKHRQNLWESIVNHKLIWVKELDEYFEITVNLEDSNDTYKNITATSLCEAELGQINIYGMEINSDEDIARTDYVVTTFYNPYNPKASLLNRAMSFAPHYKIKYVEESLWDIQRTFSVDGTALYDFLTGDCATEIGCLFQFDSKERSVSVYDLHTTCKDCGERSEFTEKCPECGSKNLRLPTFGKDTTILIDKTNLTDTIHYEESPDNVKNCFKLEAGDELITATVISLNQNGSDKIYYISEAQREDMPAELVQKIDEYNQFYDGFTEEYEDLLLQSYNLISRERELESSMSPEIEHAEVSAKTEIAKLTEANLSPLSLSIVSSNTSTSSVDTAIKNYARVYVKTGYVKLEIMESKFFNDEIVEYEDNGTWHKSRWQGKFKVTNYSDEEDVAETGLITLEINDNYQNFIEQKVAKAISSEDDENTIFDVLGATDLDKFAEYLTHYSLNRLTSFYDAIQSALDVLVEIDHASEGADLYESLYVPYREKLKLCQLEIDKRNADLLEVKAEKASVQAQMTVIQSALNFETFLGDLYPIFCAYKREDTYSNSNYVSDGIETDNVKIIDKAKEFLKVAKRELRKSCEKEITITATLYNLLLIPAFAPIVDNFELGNWIRIKVDGKLYRLRLIGYEISFDDLQTINVTFSTAKEENGFMNNVESVLSSAQSMAKSYDAVVRQAEQGNEAKENIDEWVQNGLNSALITINTGEVPTFTLTKHGLIGRSYDDTTGAFSDEELIIRNNVLAFTTNGGQTVESALGKHQYKYYDVESNTFTTAVGYGLTAKFGTYAHLYGTQLIGGDIYSTNYNSETGEGTHMNLTSGAFNFGKNLSYDGEDTLKVTGTIESSIIKGTTIEGGSLLIGNKESSYAEITGDGVLNCFGANIYGNVNSEEGKIGGWNLSPNGLYASMTETYEQMTEADVALMQDIAIHNVECTDEYLEKYDFTKDNLITATDLLIAQKLTGDLYEDYKTAIGYVSINPNNFSDTFTLQSEQGVLGKRKTIIGVGNIRTNNIQSNNMNVSAILNIGGSIELTYTENDETHNYIGITDTIVDSNGRSFEFINGILVNKIN